MNKITVQYNKKNVCRLPHIGKFDSQTIIFGMNNIDADYWNEAKKHDTVKNKINEGIIVEIEAKKQVKIEIETKKDKDGKEKQVEKKVESNVVTTNFNELDSKKKEEIIKETFNIKTLNEFCENEKDADIRFKIEKKIDAVKNAKKDDTIDHPKSHLKG